MTNKKCCFLLLAIHIVVCSSWAQNNVQQDDDSRVDQLELMKSASNFDRAIGYLDAGKMQFNSFENWGITGYYILPHSRHGEWGDLRWIIPYLAIPPQAWATNVRRTDGTEPYGGSDRSRYYNVIETWTTRFGLNPPGKNYSDWEAKDGSRGQLFGDETVGTYRLIATSTRPLSWPQGYFDKNPNSTTYNQFISTLEIDESIRIWPGNWALDPDPESPTFGQIKIDTVLWADFDPSTANFPWRFDDFDDTRFDPQADTRVLVGRFVSDKDVFYIFDDKWNGIRYGDEINVGYPIGFDINVSGYSYAAKAYEDIVFLIWNVIYRERETCQDLTRYIHTEPIDSVFFGFLFDPDLPGTDSNGYYAEPWAADDYCYADTTLDIFLMFDKVGFFQDDENIFTAAPVSCYAFGLLKSPKDVGLTGFHFFDMETAIEPWPNGASMEKTCYAYAAGRPDLLSSEYADALFHNPDTTETNFDDLSLLKDFQEQFPDPYDRPDVNFFISCGPLTVAPGDTMPVHFVIFAGEDKGPTYPKDELGFPMFNDNYHERFADVYQNYQRAMALYNNSFQGTGPPLTPTLSAVGTKMIDANGEPVIYTEHEKVTLYWNDAAELATDILTQERDFEGYKIYKGFYDPGADQIDWGTEIYDINETGGVGDLVGYESVFQCDLDNRYEGLDPYNPTFYLGDNSGVVHTWTDTDVLNGVRYMYAITAYDHYYDDWEFRANETAIGTDAKALSVISVVPGVRPGGYVPADVDTVFERISGVGTGTLELEVMDDNEVVGHTYTVSFDDTTSTALTFSVYDETAQKTKLVKATNITDESSGAEPVAFPYFDGVGLKILNHDQIEVLSQGWTTVTGDTSTYTFEIFGHNPFDCDYEIRWLGDNADTAAIGIKTVPFQIWNVSKEPPTKVGLFITPPMGEFMSGNVVKFQEQVVPGGPSNVTTWQVIVEWDSVEVVVDGDTTKVGPTHYSVGDVYTFTTKKAFKSADKFRFSTYTPSSQVSESTLDQIRVVPNPYVVTHIGELNTNNSQLVIRDIRFTHVPPHCTIDIYTIAGDHVRTLRHDNPTFGEVHWDVLTKEALEVSYGIYIYVVKAENSNGKEIKKIGKLAVVK